MTLLVVGCLTFAGMHLLLSSGPVRRALSGALGDRGFAGIYSLVALAGFVMIVLGWRGAPFLPLWDAPAWTRWLPNVAMPIAFVLLVCAVTTKSPTAAGKPGVAPTTDTVGIVRVTRHPMLWAFGLWGLSHVPTNGDQRSVLLFATFVVMSFGGMLHIDASRAAAFPDAWASIAKATSLVPFVAIAQGRNRLVLGEIGPWRVLGGLVLWAASLHFHKVLLAVSPLPLLR